VRKGPVTWMVLHTCHQHMANPKKKKLSD
jgi:hypothetical protein